MNNFNFHRPMLLLCDSNHRSWGIGRHPSKKMRDDLTKYPMLTLQTTSAAAPEGSPQVTAGHYQQPPPDQCGISAHSGAAPSHPLIAQTTPRPWEKLGRRPGVVPPREPTRRAEEEVLCFSPLHHPPPPPRTKNPHSLFFFCDFFFFDFLCWVCGLVLGDVRAMFFSV